MNEGIKASEVRVIDETGRQVGILPFSEALKLAREKNLDLIQISDSAVPPVCKIEDYGKYRYEMEKKEKLLKKKQKVAVLKEVRIRPQIGEHDFLVKMRNIRRFLEEGHKVKVSIVFKGREIAYQELADRLLDRMNGELKDLFVVDKPPRQEGMNRVEIIAPVKK